MATVNPLVRQLGLKQVLERERAREPEPQQITDQRAESMLAGHIRTAWARNKMARTKIERRMLNCLRARRGEYSAEALAVIEATGGVNIVWHDLTETKCRGAAAWIREIVLPAGERPWALEPTPLPDLPREIKMGVVAKAVQQAQQAMQNMAESAGVVMDKSEFRRTVGELGEKLRDEAEREITRIATKRANRMTMRIADQQAQGGWDTALDEFVEDFVTYPAAVLKGPYYQRHKRLEWGAGWTPKVKNVPEQSWERVSPFDVYPAIGARDCQTGDFIERIRFTRSELHDLKGMPGYRDDEIDGALMDYSGGHLEGWLWTESERQRLEKESIYLFLSPPGIIDALNYWGSVPGWKLMSWGLGDLEPTKDYEVNAVLCGRFVLYASINPDPLGRRPYWRACYDEIPGAFWGRSIPDLASTSQQMCNAIACSLADNFGLASGPMGWVHVDRLADGEQSMEWAPRKLWQLKSDPTQGVNPGVGVFQVPDNSQNLMAAMAQWETRADDATGVPRYTYGNGVAAGAGDTASGLSMLMNNAAKGLRRAIAAIDMRVIQPSIAMAYYHEMLYGEDESIKGDCVIVPRGANAILIKESAQVRRTQFLAMTANPIDMEIIGVNGRAALLREVASAMELPVDKVVPDEEALKARQQAQAQAQEQALAMQQEAQAQEQERQAQAKTAEAEVKAQADQRAQLTSIIGDIVKQAVSAAVGDATQEKPQLPKPGGEKPAA